MLFIHSQLSTSKNHGTPNKNNATLTMLAPHEVLGSNSGSNINVANATSPNTVGALQPFQIHLPLKVQTALLRTATPVLILHQRVDNDRGDKKKVEGRETVANVRLCLASISVRHDTVREWCGGPS